MVVGGFVVVSVRLISLLTPPPSPPLPSLPSRLKAIRAVARTQFYVPDNRSGFIDFTHLVAVAVAAFGLDLHAPHRTQN